MNFLPSLIVIYLTSEQKEQFIKISNQQLVHFFFEKINLIFGKEIKIISNFNELINFNELTIIDEKNEVEFIKKILSLLPKSTLNDEDLDEIYFAYFEGIYPLLNKDLTEELMLRHDKYISQYSYSENLPSGLIPKFISREFVLSLEAISNQITLHEYLLKNINLFDVEIFYKAPDLRQYRLDFSLKDHRSYLLVNEIFRLDPNLKYENLQKLLQDNAKIFRYAPSYLDIEICKIEKDTINIFNPHNKFFPDNHFGELKVELLEKIISEMELFQTKYTISLAGLGDPISYSNLTRILEKLESATNLEEVIIETKLDGDINDFIQHLNTFQSRVKKLSIIVNLTTFQKEKYKSIYNTDLYSLVESNLEILLKNFNQKNIYIQIFKIAEVEEEIDNIYELLKKKGIQLIIQKYNTFANQLKEKRSVDLTPIDRDFCWHLNRDLYVNFDGTVAVCKQVPNQKIGDLNSQTIQEVWNSGLENFRYSFLNDHLQVTAPCLKCDEWYTFNA